ncbi:hypothetical protein B0H11DRAFT_2085143 [Mycena galericulata]|nr:hypothetical protein B0H11DRAFT_2085143 [Mycena galericulata]
MANIASQVVLHPAVSQGIRAYRAVQNFARFYAWFLISRGDKADAARWTALKSHLGTARKLLRLGKPMEHLQAALRGRAQSIKFANFQSDTAAKIGRIANRSWLAGILLSIIHAAIKTRRLTREAKLLKVQKHGEKDLGLEADREAKLRVVATTRAAIRHQFIIDILDLWIPATALGLSNLNDGVVGIFGFVFRFVFHPIIHLESALSPL